MKRIREIIISLVVISLSSICYANDNLSNQLEVLRQKELQIKASAQAEQERLIREQKQREERERKAAQRLEVKRQAEKQRREAFARKREAERQARIQKEKDRNKKYQDELRSIELKRKELALESEKARVERTHDFIDEELKQKSAETDVIQSRADEKRNLSSGAKSYLASSGEAEIRSAEFKEVPIQNNNSFQSNLYIIIGVLGGMVIAMISGLVVFLVVGKRSKETV